MKLNRDADLMYLLGACGSALHDELKKLSGHFLVPKNVDILPHMWDHPPMLVKADMLGTSLAQIPDLVIGHLVEHHEVDDVWQRCAGVMCDRPADLPNFVRDMFPDLPIYGLTPVNVMARVLALLASKGGKVTFPIHQMLMTHQGQSYGITGMSVIAPSGGRRLKRQVSLDTWTAVNLVGARLNGSPKFLDLQAHVTRWAPKLLPAFRVLVGAAVHRGTEFETQLLDCFEFDPKVYRENVTDPWDRAREIVKTSTENPTAQLHELLKEVIGSGLFVKSFGAPERVHRRYTEHMRRRHSDAIEALDGYEKRKSTKALGRNAPAANAATLAAEVMLKFQQSIGL